MPLPLQTSTKVGIFGRVKALAILLLPFLAFAVVVFLFSESLHKHPAAVREKVSQQSANRADGWLFANSTSSADATVELKQALQGATTVTIYTITPKY